MKLDHAVLKTLPKVLLHEHLDGVLRPATIIELAKEQKYDQLPSTRPEELSRWFHQGANQGSLPKYLEGFSHTIAVMQTQEALERVAYEQAEDLSRDGVIYFETRFAPLFHTRKGLTHQQVISAVLKGLEEGRKSFGIGSGLLICAMRNMDASLEMAELAVDFRDRGVVGFDLAGEEGGFHLRNTSMLSTIFNVRISTSPFMPERVLAKNRSGRQFSTAALIASVTARA